MLQLPDQSDALAQFIRRWPTRYVKAAPLKTCALDLLVAPGASSPVLELRLRTFTPVFCVFTL